MTDAPLLPPPPVGYLEPPTEPLPGPQAVAECTPDSQADKGICGATLVSTMRLRTGCRPLGLTVSLAMGLLIVTSATTNQLLKYRLSGDVNTGYHLSLVSTVGTKGAGALQFDFQAGGGALALTVPRAQAGGGIGAATVLVTETANGRVQEVNLLTDSYAGALDVSGSLSGAPRGVCANAAHIAVSAWKQTGGDHVVHVFCAVTRAHLRTLGGAQGASKGRLLNPMGIRFISTGRLVAVADKGNERISVFSVDTGDAVREIYTRGVRPFDVEECRDGFLIASAVCHVRWYQDDRNSGPVSLDGGRAAPVGVFAICHVSMTPLEIAFVLESTSASVEVSIHIYDVDDVCLDLRLDLRFYSEARLCW